MQIAALTALAGIFLILQAAYGSWTLAAATLLLVPLAISGAFAAALVVNGSLSLGSLLGVLATFALTVRQCMALTSHFLELGERHGTAASASIAAQAIGDRVTPIVVSALTIALGLVPMVCFAGKPGLEFMAPMAIALLGGLVTATFTVLFALPAILIRFGADREPNLSMELA